MIMTITETSAERAADIAQLIRDAHRDVAERFALSEDNCPRHTAFCSADRVAAEFARGERYFLMEADHHPIACVAYERPNTQLAYLNRLSVLPEYRRRGIGEQLVRHVIGLARADGVSTVSIGIIGEHTHLLDWYTRLGCVCGEVKHFPHLPFTVRYMTYPIAAT